MPKSQKRKNSKSTCSSCAPPRDTYSRGAPVPKAALWCALSRAYSVPCDALWCAPLLNCVPIEFTQFEGLKGCVFKPLQKPDLLEGDAKNIIIIFGDYDGDIF